MVPDALFLAEDPGQRLGVSTAFSVIVPVYEQWSLVPTLLDALGRQTFREVAGDESFELILVDNGSRDRVVPALPAWARVFDCEVPGSYAARNLGIDAARRDWLVFTDADCRPAPDWLQRIAGVLAAQEDEEVLVAGAIRMTAQDDRVLNPYQIYDLVKGIPQDWYVSRGYATTANLCVPRRAFERVGSFDASRFSGGDAEFCQRALAFGYRLAYAPEAVVEHPARDSWQALETKARRVKGGQLAAGSLRRRAMYFLRSFTPPVIAVTRFLRQSHLPRKFRCIAVLVQLRIWVTDMHEALRLGLGARPERR